MKKKNIYIIVSVIIILIILAIIGFNTLSISPSESTAYSSISSDKDNLIYLSPYQNILGFTNIHLLGGNIANAFTKANLESSNNHQMWKFYLNINGFNPDDFNEYSGNQVAGVISPKGSVIDLSSIGFNYDSVNNVYKGSYQEDTLINMANLMSCNVSGNTFDVCFSEPVISSISNGGIPSERCIADNSIYSVDGIVTYVSGNGFVCNVDTAQFFNQVTKSFNLGSSNFNTQFAGINGKVEFYKTPVNQCRVQDERCGSGFSGDCCSNLICVSNTQGLFSCQPNPNPTPTPTPTPSPNPNNNSLIYILLFIIIFVILLYFLYKRIGGKNGRRN